jgi:hypothetical protein
LLGRIAKHRRTKDFSGHRSKLIEFFLKPHSLTFP